MRYQGPETMPAHIDSQQTSTFQNIDLTGVTRTEFEYLRRMYPLESGQPFPQRSQVIEGAARIAAVDVVFEPCFHELKTGSAALISTLGTLDDFAFLWLLEMVRRCNRLVERQGEDAGRLFYQSLATPIKVGRGEDPRSSTSPNSYDTLFDDIDASHFALRQRLAKIRRGQKRDRSA